MKKTITLRSSDGESFEVEEAVAMESQTIKRMIEDGGADTSISVPNVSSKILAQVIGYCKRHVAATAKAEEDKDLKTFDQDFVKVDQDTLLDLATAAYYLNISSLCDLTSQAVADMIKDKTPEEVRVIFKVENDFTPEEEEAIRRKYAWVFEGYM